MVLLSRVADHLYWAARYLERAEDTARIVGAYTDVVVDLPTSIEPRWEALLAIPASRTEFDAVHAAADEVSVVEFVMADRHNAGSVVSCIADARDNLRACREVVPRVAWQVVNDLHRNAVAQRADAVSRRTRARYVEQVVAGSQRFAGVLDSVLTHDEAYDFLLLGRLIERADMTTRVLGVRAAALMAREGSAGVEAHDAVQWMGILRSLTALQMYQRRTRSAVEGASVVGFLLLDAGFPRSVVACLRGIGDALARLPRADHARARLADVFETIATVDVVRGGSPADGALLDREMDRIQEALFGLHAAIHTTYFAPER
jgi:uncharacterized alpha-E superfamily protein